MAAMNSGLLADTSTLPAPFCRQRSSLRPFHSRELHLLNLRTLNWPSLHCLSSPFRTRAMVEEKGFYELLGMSDEVTFNEIKKAYKQLARKYHPDVLPPDMTEEYTRRFIKVHEAYETLSDPGRRAAYDMAVAMGLHSAFSTRRFNERSQWRKRWQCQLLGLQRMSTANNEDLSRNLSWVARMRRWNRNAESSSK